MAKDDETEWLRKRLDVIIQLLLELTPGGAASTARKIDRLLALGFSQPEVAQVVGKKVNYVTAVVAGMKKSTSARKNKKKGQPKLLPAPPVAGEEQ
ncbi:MAG: hypothetical protein ACLQKH_09325 [Steroidobacteraceae bacterium]